MDKQQKLAMLMQPALIRLIDQLRQQLTAASIPWTYETTELWPEDVPQETRQQYDEMMQALDVANDDDADKIHAVLETLPQPVPLYRLEIEQNDEKTYINMWELCYQICLQKYKPQLQRMQVEAPNLSSYKLDKTLWESNHSIDWEALNQKAKKVVARLAQNFQAHEPES